MNQLVGRFFCLVIFLHSYSASFTQDTSNRGTDFWLGYGHHQFMASGANSQSMVLYFSTGDQQAVVTLTIDSSGTTNPATWWSRVYTIPANTVVSIENFAASSYTASAGPVGAIPKGAAGQYDARLYSDAPPVGNNSTGVFRKKGIHVTSDVPIAVHAHIYGSASSGATMILPVEAWGYTYYSINSKQEYASNAFSWLYVVAKEDSTVIEITPSVKTVSQNLSGLQPGVATTILLQKGQVYQLLGANLSSDASGNGGASNSGNQLTGTKIRALIKGRPVAAFSGSSRTTNAAACGSGGGDNDIVQLFPLHVWGKKYLTAPTSGSTVSSLSTNAYKIAVYDPTTVVRRNGVILNSLISNSYYTFESNTPDLIEADKPIMLAQFMLGGSCNTGSNGDPDMYYISPIDGGIKTVSAIRTAKETVNSNTLTLIVPTAGLTSLRIDNSSLFDYSYAHPQLPGYMVIIKRWTASLAQFSVQCDSAFTGITYGTGPVESYGFNIGARFNPLHGIDPMYRIRWSGTVSSDWRNAENWSTRAVPSAEDNILIPALTPNSLVIDDGVQVSCNSMELETGAFLTVKPSAKLHIRNPIISAN